MYGFGLVQQHVDGRITFLDGNPAERFYDCDLSWQSIVTEPYSGILDHGSVELMPYMFKRSADYAILEAARVSTAGNHTWQEDRALFAQAQAQWPV